MKENIMSYTDKIKCPKCKETFEADVEVEYVGINDMSAIITPIERREPMVSVTEVVERTISVKSTDGETEHLEVLTRGECITKVDVFRHGRWLANPTAIDVMIFVKEHTAEFLALIKEVEYVKTANA